MITLNSGFEASAVLASVSLVQINRITENIAMTVVLQEKCLIQFFQSGKFPGKCPRMQTNKTKYFMLRLCDSYNDLGACLNNARRSLRPIEDCLKTV